MQPQFRRWEYGNDDLHNPHVKVVRRRKKHKEKNNHNLVVQWNTAKNEWIKYMVNIVLFAMGWALTGVMLDKTQKSTNIFNEANLEECGKTKRSSTSWQADRKQVGACTSKRNIVAEDDSASIRRSEIRISAKQSTPHASEFFHLSCCVC